MKKQQQSREEKLKLYRQTASAHKPKNRSSKHERWLKGARPIVRCVSGAQLNQWSGNGMFEATVEIERRAKKRAKKEAKG